MHPHSPLSAASAPSLDWGRADSGRQCLACGKDGRDAGRDAGSSLYKRESPSEACNPADKTLLGRFTCHGVAAVICLSSGPGLGIGLRCSYLLHWGIPDSSVVKKKKKKFTCSAGAAGDSGSIPGSGRSPGGGSSNLPQYSSLENPTGWRSLVGNSP